jgi:alkanesulfonate monooxygenase SsuD/methylene tetrahydromethanopterin reductase-like flavin-dependent oxidoreductase (luciferase family)
MDFGLFYEMQCLEERTELETYRELIEQVELAEQVGFDAIWLAELHFHRDFSILPAPMLVASALALRTKKIRLGIGVNVLPVHHPVRLAEDSATLDILSSGRLDFGAGRGHPFTGVYEGFGVPIGESRERFGENLEIILQAWTKPRLSFKGRFHTIEDIEVVPKPVQKPHPPVYIAAVTPETFSMIAEKGFDIYYPAQVTPIPMLKDLMDGYRKTCLNAGRDPSRLRSMVLIPVYVSENQRQAKKDPEQSMMRYYEIGGRLLKNLAKSGNFPEQYKYYLQLIAFFDTLTYERVLREFTIFGDPSEVRDKITWIQEELGVTQLLTWMNYGGLQHHKIVSSMRLFAEKVMPHFKP